MSGIKIGSVTHFFDKKSVVVIQLSGDIKIGDHIHILGRSADFQQEVTSMQIEHQTILKAESGMEVALKVIRPVRLPASVYLLDDQEIE